jgi:hypothetical protein
MNLDNIFSKYSFDDTDKSFIKQAQTATTADMNLSRVVAEIILSKRIEKTTDDIIESNEKLTDSNKKYMIGTLILTSALVFVGLIQIFVNI